MSRQLELDINRPSWAETDYRSEVKDLWSVRTNDLSAQDKNKPITDNIESVMNANNEYQNTAKEL